MLIDGKRRRKLEQLYLAELALGSADLASAGPEVAHAALALLESELIPPLHITFSLKNIYSGFI